MKKLFTNCIEEVLFFLLFLVVYGSAIFFSVAYAGGQEYYLPDSEGNCGVISDDSTQDDIDFINHRGKYLMMIKADEMMTLNACNTGEFKCYRIKAACGEHVHTFIFWRAKSGTGR
jgi:hypothetical protein